MHTLYKSDSGEIVGHLTCPECLLAMNLEALPAGICAIEYAGIFSGDEFYFDLINTIRPRPTIEAEPNQTTLQANNGSSVTINNLPIPCTVRVDAEEFTVDDGEFEFSVDVQGLYTVTVDAFPYISKSWEVMAL
jgi:hypothetical protein